MLWMPVKEGKDDNVFLAGSILKFVCTCTLAATPFASPIKVSRHSRDLEGTVCSEIFNFLLLLTAQRHWSMKPDCLFYYINTCAITMNANKQKLCVINLK